MKCVVLSFLMWKNKTGEIRVGAVSGFSIMHAGQWAVHFPEGRFWLWALTQTALIVGLVYQSILIQEMDIGLAERPRWHVERWDSCVKWSSGRKTKALCCAGSHSILNAGCSLYRQRHWIHVMEDGGFISLRWCKELKMPIDAMKCCRICERLNIKNS